MHVQRKRGCTKHLLYLNLLKNKLTSVLRCSEKTYYSQLLQKQKNNVKGTWKILKTIINKLSSTRQNTLLIFVMSQCHISNYFILIHTGVTREVIRRVDAGEHNVMPMNKGLFTTRHHNGDEDGIIQDNQIHRHSMLHCW